MKKTAFLLVVLILTFFAVECRASSDFFASEKLERVGSDFRNFYLDRNNLFLLGLGMGGSALLANTSVDGDVREFYQDDVRGGTTDAVSKVFRRPGDYFVTVPLVAAAHFFFRDTPLDDWAQRSARALVVGAPAGLFLQYATGGSRPSDDDSGWKPFRDNEGVSQHAFIGAVPFLAAAGMNENVYVKGLFYGLSVLPGLSRINDDKHYLSQAVAGWYLALLSCNAVDRTEKEARTMFSVSPLPGGGLAVLLTTVF